MPSAQAYSIITIANFFFLERGDGAFNGGKL